MVVLAMLLPTSLMAQVLHNLYNSYGGNTPGYTNGYVSANGEYSDFIEAAQKGVGEAQYNVGVCCYEGIGTHVDYEAAVEWWLKAAEKGVTPAYYNLGHCYENGYETWRLCRNRGRLWRRPWRRKVP